MSGLTAAPEGPTDIRVGTVNRAKRIEKEDRVSQPGVRRIMSVSAAIIERLRESLEEVVPRSVAASLLFGALARWGPRIPTDHAEVAAFVRGALRDELADRLKAQPLAPVMRALEEILATAAAPTADHEIPIEIDVPVTWREEKSTKAMRSIAGPVPVLVIAATTAFALRLKLALGDAVIDVETRAHLPEILRALGQAPALTVIDAKDPTPMAIEHLADTIVHATQTTTVVWGSDNAYGKRIIDAADARGVQLAGIATSEGIGPIFDLVTSRRA